MTPNRLTPEREAEIRETLNEGRAWESDLRTCLSEIDALRKEAFHYDQQYYNQKCATDEFQRKYKNMEEERDALKAENEKLRERVEKLRGALNLIENRCHQTMEGDRKIAKEFLARDDKENEK